MMRPADMRDRLIELLEPVAAAIGYELVDIEWHPGRRDSLLRVFIDLPPEAGRHVGLEDCERVSHELSAALDAADPIEQAYSLEVSSPGFDRVLRVPAHFRRFIGARVKVELRVPRAGRKRYTGTLLAADEERIELEVDRQKVGIGLNEIGRARLDA